MNGMLKHIRRLHCALLTAAASVEEYLTMVAGGLAGATPHMISATVTAISRLVFEFRGEEDITYGINCTSLTSRRLHIFTDAHRDTHDSSGLCYVE